MQHDEAMDREERIDNYTDAMKVAAARIRRDRKRLSPEAAEQIVSAEFAARGVPVVASAASSIAHNLLNVYWPLLHPLRARREGWTWVLGRR
jgi:hypothetical protein